MNKVEPSINSLNNLTSSALNKRQYAELEETIQQVNNGEMKMMSFEEAKAELKKRYHNQ